MGILALETDASQAQALRRVVCDLVGAQLTVVASTGELLHAIRGQRPDVILLPPLVSPAVEAELVAFLRTVPDGAHVQTLITPVLGNDAARRSDRGWLRWGPKRAPAASGSEESRVFAERLAWSLDRVREGRPLELPVILPDPVVVVDPPPALVDLITAVADHPGVLDGELAFEDSTTRLLRKLGDDRCAHRRFAANDLRGLRSARIKFGPHVTVLDVSAGGALIETDARLRPESEATLELFADARQVIVPFRVLRCQLTALDGVPRYRGACEFSSRLDLADLLVPGSLESLESIESAILAGGLGAVAPAAERQRVLVRNAW